MLPISGLRAHAISAILSFFDHGVTFTAPGLLESDGLHLSNKGKRILACELTDGESFKPGLKREGNKTRLFRDKPKGGKCESKVKSAQLKCMHTNIAQERSWKPWHRRKAMP